MSLQQERHQGQFLVARQIAETQTKLFGVVRTVVRRHPHPEQHDLGAGRRGQVDHLREIGAHLRDRQRAQSVIAAQFQDDDLRDDAASARAAGARAPRRWFRR